MNNLIVTSGGFNSINNYVSEENIKMFEEISKNKKVIIIANAAPSTSGNYIARENVKENFLKVGAIKADIVDLNKDNVSCILDYDVIYMLGGNVRYLIELNRDTNIKEVLLKFLEKGIYIGESAGSMILGKNLKWLYEVKKETKPKYDVILDTYEGFGLIDINVYPHYQKVDDAMKEKVRLYELNNNTIITKLNDGDIITYNI